MTKFLRKHRSQPLIDCSQEQTVILFQTPPESGSFDFLTSNFENISLNLSPEGKKNEKQQDRIIEKIADLIESQDEGRRCQQKTLKEIKSLILTTNWITEDVSGVNSNGIKCALIALLYLDRVDQTKLPSNDPLVCFKFAFLIALKFTEDYPFKLYTLLEGFTSLDLNILELEFLLALDWNCSINYTKFEMLHSHMTQD